MVTQSDRRLQDPRRPKAAPVELAGQWVAWDRERTEIVASGDDFAAVREEAIASGHTMPLMEVVPRPCSFIG